MKSKYKIKEDAELYRLGVLSGYISRDEVIRWADEMIKNLEAPPYELVEISTSKNINDIISRLKEVRGQYSFKCVFKRFVELLYHTLTKDLSKARNVAHQLYIFMSECE